MLTCSFPCKLNKAFMVEINFKNPKSLWIESVVLKWSKKLGRLRIAKLFQKMYVMHCTDKRKRSLPDIQDLVATIDLDENGNMKLTSKLVQCFFFFWDPGLFLATDATCDQMLNATCTADIDPINEIHS